MITHKLTQVINRPIEDIFQTIVDIENFPKWNPTVTGARITKVGTHPSNSEFEMKIKGFGWVPQTLEQYEENKKVIITPHMKSMGGGHLFVLNQTENGVQIQHELTMIPRGIFKLMKGMMRAKGKKNLEETAKALEEFLVQKRK